MRILYFLDFPDNFGGASNEVLNQARFSKKSGNIVKVIIPTDQDGNYSKIYDCKCEELELDYEHAYINVATEMINIQIFNVLKAINDANRCIEEFAPDLIHSVQVNIAVELVARDHHIPNIMSVFQARKKTFYFDYLKVYPKYHIADSKIYSMLWRKCLSIQSACIRMGYESIHNQKLESISVKKNINIVCVGVVCKRKNQLGAMRLVNTLVRSGYQVRLDCWGQLAEKDYVKDCMDYIERNHLQDFVCLKGFTMEARREIRKADVLISCSYSESFPVVIIESFQNGVPVIATPVGGISEVIKNGHNGYLTEGIEQKDLEKSFFQYYNDRENGKINTVIHNAFQTFEELFLEEKNFDKLKEYYHFVCKDYRGKSLAKYTEISLKEFQQIWKPYFNICDTAEDSGLYDFDEIKLYRSKLWWIYHMKKKLLQQINTKRFYLWGAGFWGKRMYNLCCLFMPEIRIEGYIDSYKQGTYCGLHIYEPDVLKENDMVLISNVLNSGDIVSYLEQRNFKENINYFKFGG